MGIIVINSYAFGAASATAGITTSIVSDGDSDGDLLGASSNNFSDGEILQVQYSGSGGSSVTYTFNRSGAAMSVGTLSDGPAGARATDMFIMAWKGNANPASGSNVTLSGSSGSVHTTVEETGTWYLVVKNATGSNFDMTIVQNVDSGTATASTDVTIVDNS